MIQLNILSGKRAGDNWVARRFPVRIGRSPQAELQLEEDGVWEQHLQLLLNPRQGFVLRTEPGALATVNREPVRDEALLRNGDLIEAGSLKLQFWLSETRQRGLKFREYFTWVFIAGISIAQVVLVYWLRG